VEQDQSAVDGKIAGFARAVIGWHLVLVPLILIISGVALHRVCWGIPVGFALGVSSFFVLVYSVQHMKGSNSRILGISLALTTFKFALLFCLVAAIWYTKAVDLLEVLGGILASQFAISGASFWVSRGLSSTHVKIPEHASA